MRLILILLPFLAIALNAQTVERVYASPTSQLTWGLHPSPSALKHYEVAFVRAASPDVVLLSTNVVKPDLNRTNSLETLVGGFVLPDEPLVIKVRAVDLFDVTSEWVQTDPFFFIADKPAPPVMLQVKGNRTVTVQVK